MQTKTGAVYASEKFVGFYDEAFPLLVCHYREISHYQDIFLDVDTARYLALESAGMLRIYTARVDGKLVGYAVFVVNRNSHYQESVQAVGDVLFVQEEHRRGRLGINLIKYAEESLRTEGIQVVYHHVKAQHLALAAILERENYQLVDLIYAKRLDVNPLVVSGGTLADLVDNVLTFFRLRGK